MSPFSLPRRERTLMHKIAEKDWLVRARLELPTCLALASSDFRDGWDFIQLKDAERLDKRLRTMGWNLVKVCGFQKSGVGGSSQQAIGAALKVALRTVSEHLPAIEVGGIYLKPYPWFCLATVVVYPYWIQQYPVLPAPDRLVTQGLRPEPRRLSLNLDAFGLQFDNSNSLRPGHGIRTRMAR